MKIYRKIYSPIEENTYVLADESGDCAIIDCGCYSESEFSSLVSLLENEKLTPVLLLNTHCHLDHIFGNIRMLEKFNLLTQCSELDEDNRKNATVHASFFGLQMKEPPLPGRYIKDGDIIGFGRTKLKALHVPGHSPGSLAFYSEADKCVFTGDAIFAGSIGRTDLQGGNYQTLINSLKNKILTLPPETVIYPGHGNSTTVKKESETNPYLT